MGRTVTTGLAATLDTIARAVLGETADAAVQIGGVTLHAHQRDALRRVRASVVRAGGALLADEPGLGKTYVALALAREYPHAVVVAPAALRIMWIEAAHSAETTIRFVSLEWLSRHEVNIETRGGLVIVDEAHHVCNPSAARYSRLARLVSYRRVLLLSATPVRNRRVELGALLALFMGPRAHTIDDAERAQCIVRRAGATSQLPALDGPHWRQAPDVPGLTAKIERLPPALPVLDGRAAHALVRMTLARCWASSLAALDVALRRRLQQGAALEALLDDNRVPTRDELRAWIVGDDSVQLAFPMLVSHETRHAPALRTVLETHLRAIKGIRKCIAPHIETDLRVRARMLLDLRAARSGAKLIAFTAHAATAEALYRALSKEPGVALLTARRARTAGGARPRADVIRALESPAANETAAPHHARDEISLVVTTDLLSEGVNLQGASIIVHLDIPWTNAGLDQRVGRAVRIGSPHRVVRVHGITPPRGADRLLSLERRLVRKHAEQLDASRAPELMEELRTLMQRWRNPAAPAQRLPRVASMHARRAGFIAAVEERGEILVVAGEPSGYRRWRIGTGPRALLDLARDAAGRRAPHDAAFETVASGALMRWLHSRLARTASGAGELPTPYRRHLLRRIDAVVARSPSHARPALAARAIRLRSLIECAISAGAEQEIARLARADASDAQAWFEECESRLGAGLTQRESPGGGSTAVRALLLLRP